MNILQLVPDKLAQLLIRFMQERINGSVTVHFNHGKIAAWDIHEKQRPDVLE